jgi:signal transduction histidine kinase
LNLRQPKALTGRFALLCGVIVAIAGAMLYFGGRETSVADLRVMAERNNVALTRAFANAIRPNYAEFFAEASRMNADDIRKHTTTAQLRADTIAKMQGLAVLKVKIYDLKGKTIFSTQASQIGEDKSRNAGFVSARSGHVVSELSHRDTFSAFEQEIVDRDVLSSYIPVLTPSGEVEGVFEVYYDLTELLARISRSSRNQFLVVGATLSFLYVLLLWVIFQRDRDVAARHRENLALAAEAAAASEQSRLKSEFLANMSHELRTPLNAILGFSDTMRQGIFGPIGSDKYRSYLDDIWNSGRHLLDIVDDVLDMSKIESGNVQIEETEFALKDMVRQSASMIEPLASTKRLALELDLPADDILLRGDERRISQMLLNILSNAVKFSPDGAKVEFFARVGPVGELRFEIRDQGPGIAAEDIETVMKPFGQVAGSFARDHGGTGLGLPIAKSFAELHGGFLQLDSAPGRGTAVTIVLPAARTVRPQPRIIRASAA